jgi:hypothetical protein
MFESDCVFPVAHRLGTVFLGDEDVLALTDATLNHGPQLLSCGADRADQSFLDQFDKLRSYKVTFDAVVAQQSSFTVFLGAERAVVFKQHAHKVGTGCSSKSPRKNFKVVVNKGPLGGGAGRSDAPGNHYGHGRVHNPGRSCSFSKRSGKVLRGPTWPPRSK